MEQLAPVYARSAVRRRRVVVGSLLAVCVGLAAAPAHAIEPGEIADEPVRLDVTASSSFLFSIDNRNTEPGDTNSSTDDNWALWYNRLDTQADWNGFSARLRIDSAYFPVAPHPAEVALDQLDLRREGRENDPITQEDAQFFLQRLGEAGNDLSTRYINWTYPSKYHLAYSQKEVEITAGDFYAQLGRGLVLSIRKLDELTSDTTIRGAKLSTRFKVGDVKFRATGLGGTANPLRIDEASGRYLSVDDSVTPNVIGVTEAGMPRTVESGFQPNPAPSYAPDSIFGAEIEGGPKQFQLGFHGAMFRRQDALTADIVRTADQILNGSVSVNVPNLDKYGSAYVEVAMQDLSHENAPDTDLTGYAVYGNVNLFLKPVTVTLEGKHYRRFFPVTANTDVGTASEFQVQYSAPPTTEAYWVDTEFEQFNTCTTGGRGKLDLRIGKNESVFGWVGHYLTWAESVANEECEIRDDAINRVWDFAAGGEIKTSDAETTFQTTIGARLDDVDRVITDARGIETTTFYQEGYFRYDFIVKVAGPVSLQFIGNNRRRLQTFGGALNPWNEGENLAGVQYSPHGSAFFGFEYDTNPATPTTYLNGVVNANIDDVATIAVFGGQRRGGIRCVAGVCRFFPPFEGGRIDASVRF